ncbi:MAG: helix-turn-helix domain-containing protein, partial [bacterium]|nr:helix-turn-helix domain-containing protein [bacterium]
MVQSLPVKARQKLLNRVLKQKISISQACREFGVSRVVFYKWLRRYQAGKELRDKPRRIRSFWRQVDQKIVEQVQKVALDHPEWSKYRIHEALPKDGYGQPILGIHGVYNILRRLTLSTPEKRACQKQLLAQKRSRVLTPQERLAMINRVLKGGLTVTQACRELSISRMTFYKWIKRYQKTALPDEQLTFLKNKERQVKRWWRQATSGQEELVLKVVIESPNLSKYKIAEKLGKIAGYSFLGAHGVYNVLRRRNLTLPEARLAYSQTMAPIAKPVPWVDRLHLVWEKFIPALAPAPPPHFGKLLGSFLAPFAFASILGSIFLLWLRILGGQPFSVQLGLIFASLSLTFGFFFFLYSLKYYFTLVLILGFSRQVSGPARLASESIAGGEENGNGKRGILERLFGVNFNSNGHKNSGGDGNGNGHTGLGITGGLQPDLSKVELQRKPFVSIHLPLYNEPRVVDRLLTACTGMDYENYEVIIVDDSTDQTTQILRNWQGHPRLKIIHRENRQGFKGGA